ncbi:MAG: [protein-PII] uridylyltransferase family protein, partial [Chloroflexota bacterium]
GLGGLRDVHAMLWAGMVAFGVEWPEDLARLGYLAADEVAVLWAAVDFLLKARQHLHYVTGRKTDRLFFAYQEETASFLGYMQANGHLPVERMMLDLNAHADAILRATVGFWEHVEDEVLTRRPIFGPLSKGKATARTGLAVRGDRLELVSGASLPLDAERSMTLFAEAARRNVVVGHGLARTLRAALPDGETPVAWSPAAVAGFFEVLRAGDLGVPLLETMAACGLLGAYLPEWEGIRHLAHHDVYHLYTVDHHSTLAVQELNRLAAGVGAEGNLGATVAAEVSDYDVLLLAGLLHDLGKGWEGDHSETGASLARQVGERMGLPAPTVDTLAFLVRHHLAFARIATKRDLDDETVIQRLARLVGTADRLRMLYLLTVADSVATGPSAWSDWKATLMRDLFFRTWNVLHDREDGASQGDRLAARRELLLDELSGLATHQQIEGFLARMPEAYLLAQSPSAIRRHFALLGESDGRSVRVSFARADDGIHDELVLVAADRPGLLWAVCGVFALHGVNIVEARVYTELQGTALDVFRLADAFEGEIGEEKRQRIARDLDLALTGRLALGYRLARKLKHYRPSRVLPMRPAHVTVDNAESVEYTVIEVRARDRLGLLYTIARAFADLQLDIHLAKVSTHGPEAIDVFYVRYLANGKVTDGQHIQEIERAVLFELEGPDR